MCWVGNLTDIKVADNDITVYKILMKKKQGINCDASARYLSPFMFAPYSFYVVEHKKLIKPVPSYANSTTYTISEGLHCYSENVFVKSYGEENGLSVYSKAENVKGHRPVESYISSANRFPVVIKCIIPEGSTYYENMYGEIVTQRLIIKEEVKLPEYSLFQFKDIR